MRSHRARVGATLAAAAIAGAVLVAPQPASAATVTSIRTLTTVSIAAGSSRTYTWNNANSDIYQASAAAMKGSGAACQVEITRQWYQRAAGADRKFLFTVKNVDSATCTVTPYLALITADATGSSVVINPGVAKGWHWNNSNLSDRVYFVGVTPADPGSGTCQLETSWKARAQPSGEQEFVWYVKNTGTVACEGQYRLGSLPADERTLFDDGGLPPGHTGSLSTPITEPFRVYLWGLMPLGTPDGTCEWGPRFTRLQGDQTVPTANARTTVGYLNSGSTTCENAGVTRVHLA